MTKSILIITLPPLTGGVPDKAKILANHLRKLGYTVTVSHYATYRDYPELTVPISQLLKGKKPNIQNSICFNDFPCISIGCWLPELEFTYYLNSKYWRKVIKEYQRHIVVGGTVLTSYPLTQLGIPHLIWCASSMIEDRIDRRKSMFFPRKLLDRVFISPIQKIMEKNILLGKGHCMAVSSYTVNSLTKFGGNSEKITKVPIPIDLSAFCMARVNTKSSPPRTFFIGFIHIFLEAAIVEPPFLVRR